MFLLGGYFVVWAEEDELIDKYKAEIAEKKVAETTEVAEDAKAASENKEIKPPPPAREKNITVLENKVFKNARSNASNDIYLLCIGGLQFVNVVGSGYGRTTSVYTEITQVMDVTGLPKTCVNR